MDINVGLYLVRHGETDWNIESKIQGRTDTELNEKGRRQAQELAVVLKEGYGIKRIFTSRQKRAVETAEIIGETSRNQSAGQGRAGGDQLWEMGGLYMETGERTLSKGVPSLA